MILFDLGQIVSTLAGAGVLKKSNVPPDQLLLRHATGDWGEIPTVVRAANKNAITNDGTVTSLYSRGLKQPVEIITDIKNKMTVISTPGEL